MNWMLDLLGWLIWPLFAFASAWLFLIIFMAFREGISASRKDHSR